MFVPSVLSAVIIIRFPFKLELADDACGLVLKSKKIKRTELWFHRLIGYATVLWLRIQRFYLHVLDINEYDHWHFWDHSCFVWEHQCVRRWKYACYSGQNRLIKVSGDEDHSLDRTCAKSWLFSGHWFDVDLVDELDLQATWKRIMY